jgi:hypothetical protein
MEVHAVLRTRHLNFLSKSEDKWYGIYMYIPLFDCSWDKFVETIWQWNFQIRMIYTTPVPMCSRDEVTPGAAATPRWGHPRGEDALGVGIFRGQIRWWTIEHWKNSWVRFRQNKFFCYRCSMDSWWTAGWVQMSWWSVEDKRKQPGSLPISK